ncbi:MAG TPA: GAF domain-containing protein [Ginsengibacter sp.]
MSYINYYKHNFSPDNIDLPFQLQINFKKLIDWWKEQAAHPHSFESGRAKEILKRIEKIPELSGPFDDFTLIEKHQEEIQLLLSPFFPSLTTTNEIKAAGIPFKPMVFNLTKRFTDILEGSQGDVLIPENDPDLIYMFSCITVLNGYYKANVSLLPNLFFNIRNKQTGIINRYRAFINVDFTELIPGPDVRPLSEKEIFELTDNFGNTELWKKKIPPRSFSFEGFTILTLFDVTRDESVSALKFDLIKKDSLTEPANIEHIQENLGAMLNIPRLRTGFISFNRDREVLQSIGFGNSIILSDRKNMKIDDAFCNESNLFMFEKNQPVIFQNIDEENPDKNIFVKKLTALGLKSYLALPLSYNDELIGILELGSREPNVLNTITVYKLQDVILLFTTAMKRSQDEMKNQIDAIIRQKCTAIHSTVAWRFIEAAERFIELKLNVDEDKMEDIVFTNVFPLYGQTDIHGSSVERNLSIQADLIEQLSLAKNILNLSVKKFGLPVYKDLRFRVDSYIQQLGQELSAGDENIVLEFLKKEIYPVFNYLHSQNTEIHEALQHYENQLDPVLGLLYKKRKAYDESIKLINENISVYLDKAQQAAQTMFPHYFEKYKSDGVEHNLYIGQSMVNNKKFHQLYLQNLRLWQLIITCEIENEVHRLKPRLKTKLDVCSLILVHSQPLSIRFRMEEKKFDVDGAYNARYEIIKKRIDKAIVKETGERLTQPGKIAIIYSNEKEAKEYMNYIHYLQFINYISSDVETLTLKDLQGMTGLKALRVSISYNKTTGLKESKAVELIKEINHN